MNEHQSAPRAIAMIMDGNRRWAKAQGLPPFAGHRAGFEKLKEVLKWVREAGIEYLTVYAFSTENWKRSREEVDGLMDLFRMLVAEVEKQDDKHLRIRFIGDTGAFPEDLREGMRRVEAQTAGYGPFTFVVAASYGGRQEIVAAANKLAEEGGVITEERFSDALWGAGIPDPDLVMRTSGEQRLSNFLPWQSVYSELFFIEKHWPAFSREDFDALLTAYAERERRFGA